MKRRLLASLLSLVMVISLLPTAVWASDGEDDNSQASSQASITYDWKDYEGYYDAADTSGSIAYVPKPDAIGTLYNDIYAASDETDKIAVIDKALTDKLITESLANRLKAVVHVYTADELSSGIPFQKNGNTNASDFIATVSGDEMLISGEGALMAYNKYNDVFYAPANTSIALRPWNTERAGQRLSSVRFGNGITEVGEYAFFNQPRTDITSASFNANLKIHLPDSLQKMSQATFMSLNVGKIAIPASVTSLSTRQFGTASAIYVLGDPEIKVSGSSASFATNSTATVYTAKGSQLATTSGITNMTLREIDAIGACGADVGYTSEMVWTVDGDTLTITAMDNGSGVMANYSDSDPAPWNAYADQIKKIVLSSGVKTIGDNAFKTLTNVNDVTVPASVEINKNAESPFGVDITGISWGYSAGSSFETWLKNHGYTGDTNRDELGRVKLTKADNEYFREYIGDTDIAAKMDHDGVLTIYPTYSANGDTNVPGVNGYNGDNTGFPWFDVFYDENYEPAFNDKNQLTNWSGAGKYQQYLKKIVWEDGITDTGAYLFNNATNVPKDTPIELQIPDTVKTIGGFLIGGSAKSSPEVVIPENVTNVGTVINGVGGVAQNVYILNPDLTTMPANKKPQDAAQENSVRNICFGFNYTVHVKAGSKAYDKLATGDYTIKTHTDMGACGVAPYSSYVFYLYDADTKTLTIKGSGAMADYAAAADAPWASYDVEHIEIADSITHIGDYAFASLLKIKETDVTIPNGATKGNHAFAEPDEYGRMPLPQSDDLYYNAYIGTTTIAAKMSKDGIITIYPTSKDTVVKGIDGYQGDNTAFPWYESYGKEFTKDYTGVHGSEIKEIVFADGLTEIGGYLFNSMTNMSRNNIKVHIPDSVTKVGGALVGSRNYGSTVAVGSQMNEVGFWYAGSANNVYILNPNMTGIPFATSADWSRNIAYATTGADIRMHVKKNSAAYTTLTKEGTTYTNIITHTDLGACGVAPYSSEVFWTYDADSKTLTVLGDGAIKDYANASDAPWSNFGVETLLVQSGVTKIGTNAFASLTGLKTVHVADSVAEVADTAFATENGKIVDSLKNTTFLTGSEAMKEWLEAHGANVLPSSGEVDNYKWSISGDVLTIEVKDAASTDELGDTKSAVISSITAGNEPAWTAYKSIITTVKIGYGVTEIGDKVFADMPVLSAVKLPSTLTKIGEEAFANTPKLTKIYLPKKATTVADTAFGTSSSAAKNLTVQVSPVAPASQKNIESQGNTTITVDATKNLNVLLIGNSYFGALSGYMKNIAQGLGKSDTMIANYYFGGDSGNLAAYVQRINNKTIGTYDPQKDVFSGYKENGVRNDAYNSNPLSMGIEAEDWDYVVMETWGKNEPAGANGDGKLSQDPNLSTLKEYIEKYAPQAEVSLYHVYSCRSLAEQQEPKGTVLTDWQRYVNGADDGLGSIVKHVIPASTLIQNARLTYLNADGSELQRNPPSDITHLTGEGDYINAIMMYEMLTGESTKAFDHSSFDDQKEAFYHQLVDVTMAAGMKKLTYAYVEHNGTTTYYDTLAGAAAAAVKGDTLTIMAMPKSDETLQIAAGVTVKTFGSAANHTIVLNGGGAITENGLVAFTGNQVDSADVNDNENILVNYATGAIDAHSHNLTKTMSKAATCTEAGNNEYYTCETCGKVFADAAGETETTVSAETLAALGHTMSKTDAKDPTCTEAGNDAYWTCEVCGKYFSDENGTNEIEKDSWVIEALGHKLTKTDARDSTCTEAGNSAYWTCKVCGKYFSDENGTNEIEKDSWVINALGHTMTKTEAKAATCTEDGNNEYYTCETCHKVFKNAAGTEETTVVAETLKKLGHDWSNHDGICARCDAKCAEVHKPGTTCEVCGKYTRRTSSAANPGNTVSVPSTPNGTVTVTPSTATKDTTVTITTKPNEGYELGDLTVKDANGNTLPLTDKGDGKYTFTMPGSKVVVEASFVKAASTSFVDVPANAYFADAVKWAVDKGITNGLTDTMFGPYESCTRAQIVTFLWRAAGSPEPKTVSSFTDVPASAYYAKAVAWAVENGITNGMTETTFAPDATCTRGQSVTFLYRALKGTASGSANFMDVASDAFYADAVNWAVANNVTNGTSATTFSPNADCTRAEIVTFLYRAYQGK